MRGEIVVQGLGKRFFRHHPDRPSKLQHVFTRGLRRVRPIESFWGLQDVSFDIAPGRMAGVIGANGAGKSTLLRLIGGVGRPDAGSVNAQGRIGALLDLGAGAHPDLSGRDNVFVSGVIAGLTRREIAQRFDSIVAFAELEKFIDNPLRTYSTGMQMRLAFAVAVHIEPDILLIDEVLSVGDLSFQRKCLERIARFKQDDCTIVLISHDVLQVEQLCDEVLWLRGGRLVAQGEPKVVVGEYTAEMCAETSRRTPKERPVLHTPGGSELRINENRFGSLELEIAAVHLSNPEGLAIPELDSGDPLRIEIEYLAHQAIAAPIFGVTITRGDGQICCDTHTAGIQTATCHGRGCIALDIARVDLSGGRYYIDVGVYEREWAYAYDYHWQVYPLLVRPSGGGKGILWPPHRWRQLIG